MLPWLQESPLSRQSRPENICVNRRSRGKLFLNWHRRSTFAIEMSLRADFKLAVMSQVNNQFCIVLLVILSEVLAIPNEDKACLKTCLNGNCDDEGKCICDPCWSGPNCHQFDDRHSPVFNERSTKLYLSSEHVQSIRPIFSARAFDEDKIRCQIGKRCPCADTHYQISIGKFSTIFRINSSSGDLFIDKPDQLSIGTEYDLTIVAKTNYPHNTKNGTLPAKLLLTVLTQQNLSRIKRQTSRKKTSGDDANTKGVENVPTSFGLRTVSGEVNSLQVGNSIHYRLEIALPRASVDLILEIITRDSFTGNKSTPALSLYNFTVPQRVPGISFTTPEPKFFLSTKSKNVFDKMIVDFGSIKNTGPDRNVLTIYFSVVLTRKPGKSESKHSVEIGAEYSKGSLVWVAQSQITTASLSQADDQVYSNVEFDSPTNKVALDSAAIYHMNANMEFRSDKFRIEITKPSFKYEPDNLISLGHISVVKFSKNYLAIPNDPRHYESYRNKTVSELSFSKSTLDMGVITNIGEKSRSFSKNPDNIIRFAFTVYALNYKENIGKNTSFTVQYYMGTKNIYSKTVNVTIEERRQERSMSMLLESEGEFSTYNVSKGGLSQLKLKSKFVNFAENSAYVDYSLIVEVPFVRQTPLFVPCAARFVNEESGMNIPYLNSISMSPIEDSNQFLFQFGRIHLLKHGVKQQGPDDNTVVSEITFRVPVHYEIEDGTNLYANVKAVSGSKTLQVNIPLNEVSVYSENRTNQLELNTNRSVAWENMIVNGGIGMNVDIELPVNSAYQDFRVSISRDTSMANIADLHICKFSVVKVGLEMPCTCVQKDSINKNQTIYSHLGSDQNSTNYDQATINFGSISVTNRNSNNSRRKILTNFAAFIRSSEYENILYPIKVDLIAENDIIRSEMLNLTISHNDSLSEAITDMGSQLKVERLDKNSVIPGFTTNILLQVSTMPNTMGPLKVEVMSEDDELSICGLWIHHIGDNMPCVNTDTKANYDFLVYGHNNLAKLQFDTITNFGSNFRKSEIEEKKSNTLEFISMVRVAETAQENKTIKVSITYGQKNVKLFEELVIPVNESKNVFNEFPKPKSFVVRTADGNNLSYPGIAKLIYYDIELEKNSQTPITILMETSNEYKICNSAFVKIGKNYPCYSPNSLKVSPGKFQLGMICNTFLNKDNVDDNLLRLAVALRPNNNAVVERPFKVSSLAYIGRIPYNQKHELLLTVANNYSSEVAINKGATVHAEVTDNIGIKIRERKWIAFNVRIPPFLTGKLRVLVQGDSDESRAIVVLHNIRIVSGGENIPCPLENGNFKVNLSSTVATNQNNVISADLGFFSNFGFTYSMQDKNHSGRLQDDFLKIEVLVELTDHPAIVDEAAYKVTFTTFFGDDQSPIIREGNAKLTRLMEDEPNPLIDVTIKMRKEIPLLDRGDLLTLTAVIKHMPESNAEPVNACLRLFSPSFVEITRIDFANTKELPTLVNNTNDFTDILFPWILFSEEIVFNFTIQMDPKNIRGYGQEEITVVTPYRMMCEHFRSVVNSKSPCSQLKHINYRSKSSECNTPLGMESGQISDSQISASSAISNDYAPEFARPDSKKFWSPSIRNWNTKQYLQIDFLRKTRLVRITYRSIRGLRRVASYHLMHSEDGHNWIQSSNVTPIVYSGDDGESVIKQPVEARFYRFVIDQVDANKKSKNQYLAVRLEFHGCYLEEEIVNQTQTRFRTHFTDDPTLINRHIAVDPYTNVIFFCDSSLNNDHQMCYHSESGGQTWNIIGRSIDSIEGFELASGKFFAIDYDRPAYLVSNNGLSWTPVDFEEFNKTVTHSKFQKKVMIPQFHRDDLRKMNIRLGNWRINFDGLYSDDSQHPKAIWTNCCGLN